MANDLISKYTNTGVAHLAGRGMAAIYSKYPGALIFVRDTIREFWVQQEARQQQLKLEKKRKLDIEMIKLEADKN